MGDTSQKEFAMNLRIYPGIHWHDAASLCEWVLLDDQGNIKEAGNGTMAVMPKADDAMVILASSSVLTARVRLPKIKRSKLETALPFAMEEMLIEDVKDIHVTPGAKLEDGQTVLYALDRPWLLRFLAAAAAAKLRIRRIIPEYCLLPVHDGEWSLAWDGEQGLLSQNDGMGAALDCGDSTRSPVGLILRLKQQSPKSLRFFKLGEDVEQPSWNLDIPLVNDNQQFDWRKARLPEGAINLLWGKLSPPPRINELLPYLKPAFMAALLLFVVEAAFSNLEWASLAYERYRLNADMAQTFRETFGDDAVIVDAPLQMQRNVTQLRHAAGIQDSSDFTPLLARFSSAVARVQNLRLRTLRYTENRLDLELTLPGSAVNSMMGRLSEAGMSAKLLERREAGSESIIQLQITAGGMR